MWKTVKLGDVCELAYGKALDKKDRLEAGGYPAFGANGIKTQSKEPLFDKPSIIIGRKGSAGEINKVAEPFWALDVTYYTKVDEAVIDLDYLFYVLTTLNLPSLARGVKPGINRNEVYEQTISLPPLAEQQRIVAKLDAAFAEIDRAVELCQQKTLSAESIYANKLTQIFEEKDEDWTCCPLKEITSKIGSGATPKGGKAAYKEDGLSLIRSMNVYDMDFSWRELAKIDDEQAQKLSNVAVEENDVLLNITGASVARCTIAPTDALPARVNQHVAIIRTDKTRLIPTLLAYGLVARVNKETLLGVGNNAGATRQAITKRDIEEFVFSFPQKLDAQRHLVDEISSIKHESLKLAEVYRKKHENLIALKSSILAQELQPPQSEAA